MPGDVKSRARREAALAAALADSKEIVMSRALLHRTAARAAMIVALLAGGALPGCMSTEPGWAPGDDDAAMREEVTRVLATQGYDVALN
jgi:hypothetical protein